MSARASAPATPTPLAHRPCHAHAQLAPFSLETTHLFARSLTSGSLCRYRASSAWGSASAAVATGSAMRRALCQERERGRFGRKSRQRLHFRRTTPRIPCSAASGTSLRREGVGGAVAGLLSSEQGVQPSRYLCSFCSSRRDAGNWPAVGSRWSVRHGSVRVCACPAQDESCAAQGGGKGPRYAKSHVRSPHSVACFSPAGDVLPSVLLAT